MFTVARMFSFGSLRCTSYFPNMSPLGAGSHPLKFSSAQCTSHFPFSSLLGAGSHLLKFSFTQRSSHLPFFFSLGAGSHLLRFSFTQRTSHLPFLSLLGSSSHPLGNRFSSVVPNHQRFRPSADMDPARIKRKIERFEKLLKRKELAQSTTEKLAASTRARIIKNSPLSSTVSRPKVLLEKIAKSRYHKLHGVDKISLTGMAILARRIHPTEWDAVIQYSDVRDDILSHLNTLPRDLEACMSFLASLFRAKSEWARFYLLGMMVRQI